MSDITDLISKIRFQTFGMPKRQKAATMAGALEAYGQQQGAQAHMYSADAMQNAARIREEGENTRARLTAETESAFHELLKEYWEKETAKGAEGTGGFKTKRVGPSVGGFKMFEVEPGRDEGVTRRVDQLRRQLAEEPEVAAPPVTGEIPNPMDVEQAGSPGIFKRVGKSIWDLLKSSFEQDREDEEMSNLYKRMMNQ